LREDAEAISSFAIERNADAVAAAFLKREKEKEKEKVENRCV
jgi:hypothetical protein|tara:strand:- start:266 stop:391 length:126 start_codon:yes stop_codon:yes gene_type:complete